MCGFPTLTQNPPENVLLSIFKVISAGFIVFDNGISSKLNKGFPISSSTCKFPIIFAFSILLGSHMAKICGFKGKRAPRYFLKTGPWVICVLTSLIPSLSLIGDGNEAFEHLDTNTYLGARVDPIPARIQEISKKQASLAIWGYLPRIHVECERSFGVRFPTPYYIVNNYPIKSKLLKSYAHDLNHNKPLFFLHAAGSKHQILGKAEHSYLNFPSISAIIQRDYSLLIESGKMQLFIRNKTHSRTY